MKLDSVLAPRPTAGYYQWLRALKRLLRDGCQFLWLRINIVKRGRIRREFHRCRTVADIAQFTARYLGSGLCQKASEIEGALAVAESITPRTICEIGTAAGGNSLLLSGRLETADLMICIDLYVRNKAYIRLLREPPRRTSFVDGSSYHPNTVDKVRRLLDGKRIDLLFIDGDHRYEGVRSDFLLYRHLVSDGGMILFHDIVPDQGDGWLWAGGVPSFWQEIRSLYPHQEFVDDPNQKAFGIGLIHYSDKVRIPFDT